MEYIKRHAEATVNTLSKMFGAILVAGPRQVGKTTMLQRITEGMNYATLDDLIVRAVAQEQSGTFSKTIRLRCLLMKSRRHRNCFLRSRCL